MLEEAYDRLCTGISSYFMVDTNGFKVRVSYPGSTHPWMVNRVDIYPGSFNPIHKGHVAIYNSIIPLPYSLKAFEISLYRWNKEMLELDELRKRIQRIGEVVPSSLVLVTEVPLFVEKAGIFRGLDTHFHIGIDTAEILLESDGVLGVQGINALFHVYPRDGKEFTRDTFGETPKNFAIGSLLDPSYSHLSSTKIRNGEQIG